MSIGSSRRFVLTARLNVIASPGSIRRAKTDIERGLRGIVGRAGVAGVVGGGGRGGGGVSPAVTAAGIARVTTQQQRLAGAVARTTTANASLNTSFHNQSRYMSTSIRDIATLTGGYLSLHLAIMQFYRGMKGAVQFEAQLGGMAQVAHTTLKSIRGLGDTISDMSVKYGIAVSILGKSAQELLQSGKKISEVKQAIPILALLGTNAQVGAEGLQNAAKAMIVWGNVFDMTMSQTKQAFEKAIKLSKSQYVNVAQLIDSTTILASLMEGMNNSFEDTLALVAALRSETGRPVGEVARGLRTMATRVTRRPETIQYLETRGVDVYDKQTGQLRNLVPILGDIIRLQQQLGEGSREAQELEQKLFGIRRSQFGAILDVMPEVLKNLQMVSGTVNEMEHDFTIWAQTTQHAANQVSQSFSKMFRDITTESESFNLLASNVLGVTKVMFDLLGTMKDLIPLLIVVGGAALFRRFGGMHTMGARAIGATAPVRRPYGGFYTPGYTTQAPVFFPRNFRQRLSIQDRSGYFRQRPAPAGGWSTGYRTQRHRGRFTPIRGMQHTLQGRGMQFGMGAMAAGMYLGSREEPISKGVGAGLTTGGLGAMMGGGPLAVFAGLAVGVKVYVDQLELQAQRLGDAKIAESAEYLSKTLESLGDDVSFHALRLERKAVKREAERAKEGIETKVAGAGNFWDYAMDFVMGKTRFTKQMTGIDVPTHFMLDPRPILDYFHGAKQPEVERKKKIVAREARKGVLDVSESSLTNVIAKYMQAGLSKGRLQEIISDFEQQFSDTLGGGVFFAQLRELVSGQKTEVQIRNRFNDALRSSFGRLVQNMRAVTRQLKQQMRPMRGTSAKSFLQPTLGLDEPIYSKEFAGGIRKSGIGKMYPQIGIEVDEINRGLTAVGDMLHNSGLALGQDAAEIANQFEIEANKINLDEDVTKKITDGLGKINWEDISEELAKGHMEAVYDKLIDAFDPLTDSARKTDAALLGLARHRIGKLQIAFGQRGIARQARLGVEQSVVALQQRQRQFAGLPTTPGMGARVIKRAAGGDVSQLIQNLGSLQIALNATANDFKKSQIRVAIDDVASRLKMLADVSGRTADTVQRLGEVEQSRTSKLGILGEFFGGDIEQRQQIQRETRAAQMVVQRGSLLRMPGIEAQQMAVAGLQRFSGVENFMGTGQTGGQLLEKFLERAGGKWLLPEKVEEQNLQKEVLYQQKKALLAQIALANLEAQRSQNFFAQLGQAHASFLSNLSSLLTFGGTGGVAGIGAPPSGVGGVVPTRSRLPLAGLGGLAGQGSMRPIGIQPAFVPQQPFPLPGLPLAGQGGMVGMGAVGTQPARINQPTGGRFFQSHQQQRRSIQQQRQQQRISQMGGEGLPSFLTGQIQPQGAEWHRGKYVIPRGEQLERKKATYQANQMEKKLFRERDKFTRKYGPDLSGMPGMQEKFEKKKGEIIAERRRAMGFKDVQHEAPMLIFQNNIKKSNTQLQSFNQLLQALQTQVNNLFGQSTQGTGGGVGLPPPPGTQGRTSFNQGVDAGAQDLIAGLSSFDSTAQLFGETLITGTDNLNNSITQFNDSTLKLGEHITNFRDGIPELASAINDLGARLGEQLASAIPDAIDLNTKQDIAVTINGNEALGSLSDQLVQVANDAIRGKLREFTKSFSDHGPSMANTA